MSGILPYSGQFGAAMENIRFQEVSGRLFESYNFQIVFELQEGQIASKQDEFVVREATNIRKNPIRKLSDVS